MRLLKHAVQLFLVCISPIFFANTAVPQVNYEIETALKLFPSLKVVSIKGMTGEVNVRKSNGLTSNDLIGVSLQDRPPVLKRKLNYGEDSFQKPYQAPGIGPFRLNQFNCQFNYGGRNNYEMQDYAATHGFDSIYPFRRTADQISILPAGTKLAHWRGIFKYRDKWWKDQKLPNRRYDLLNQDHFLVKPSEAPAIASAQVDSQMLDMEHSPPFGLETLKKQEWYPEVNQSEFQQRYYDGYANTLTSTIKTYRNRGYKNLGIYGWSPLKRSWHPMLADEPLSRESWEVFGKQICDSVDVIHNSVYCPYADSRNVAYVLANIDENVRRAQELNNPKPVRPYFWPLISGGGGGDRWWREVPHLNEDQEAMIAMSFFLGIDGLVIWNWSGQSNHHVASFETFMGKSAKRSLMVGSPFSLNDTAGQTHQFRRYDYLHVQNFQNGVLSFQKIYPNEKENDYGLSSERPVFQAEFKILTPFLRPRSEPVAAIVRAMALVKPFELSIRNGTPQQDFDSREAFRKNLPLYRRVKTGNYHLVITYDPQTIRSGKESKIFVKDFDGNQGIDLVFPADQHPRIYIVSD